MAISYPRAMPTKGIGSQVFEVRRNAFLAPERRGRIGAMNAGFPLWSAEWTLGQAMGALQSDEWRAFIDSLAGPARLFLGYEYGREFPRAHPTGFAGMTRPGGGSFGGSATSWSQTITSDGQAVVELTGIPNVLQLSPGDYVDFRWSTGGEARRTLVRSLEAAAPVAGVLTFTANIAIPALTPPAAVAHLDNPTCLMRLDPSSQVQAMDSRRVAGGRLIAIQELLP